jgi:hypothetical protein
MESLDKLLRLSMPALPETMTAAEAQRYGRECAELAIAHHSAHVAIELDRLAREFEAAGKPNTVRAIRETSARIAAALQQASAPGSFAGPQSTGIISE